MTDASGQRCGNCQWWDATNPPWGWCRYVIPVLPFPVPSHLCIDMEAGWRDLEDVDGKDCPTWQAR